MGNYKSRFRYNQTNIEGVFKEEIRGASLVVWAIKDGRDQLSLY